MEDRLPPVAPLVDHDAIAVRRRGAAQPRRQRKEISDLFRIGIRNERPEIRCVGACGLRSRKASTSSARVTSCAGISPRKILQKTQSASLLTVPPSDTW